MSVYAFDDNGEPLTDQALIAKIVEYRKAIQDTAGAEGVGVIAGEGRRVEFFKSNVAVAQGILRDLLAEARRRNLPIGGAGGGGAIYVEFSR